MVSAFVPKPTIYIHEFGMIYSEVDHSILSDSHFVYLFSGLCFDIGFMGQLIRVSLLLATIKITITNLKQHLF